MVSTELKRLYADAHEEGIYVKEVPAEEGFMAFASSFRKLKNAGFDTKDKREGMDFLTASVWMAGAGGSTREEAVMAAVNMFKKSESWIPTA